MIQVTLTFSSLSAALMALREIPENTLNGALTDITPAPKEVAPEPAPKQVKKAKPSPAPVEAAAPTLPTAEPEALPLPAVAPAIEYAVLQKAVLQLAGKNRDTALTLAGQMGVKTFRELPAERWSEAYAMVTDKLAELGVMQ